jgi:hypothetical protein
MRLARLLHEGAARLGVVAGSEIELLAPEVRLLAPLEPATIRDGQREYARPVAGDRRRARAAAPRRRPPRPRHAPSSSMASR